MTVDIRTSKPYFRFKRGALTLFIETRAPEHISSVKVKLLVALKAQGDDDAFTDLGTNDIRLLVRQTGADTQYQPLADNKKVSECGLADDGVIYFVLQNNDGTWEDPHAADYETDAQDMEMAE
ncbi:hypothetical protein IWW50_002810 [Coemansia erecta]|nr:hypothetical protein IWW50_002810 [Coemansia erecta]